MANVGIDRVFALHQANVWKMKTSTAAERRARIMRLRDRLLAAGEEVAEAVYKDMGRPKVEMPFDVQNSIDTANEAIEHLDEWMAPAPVRPNIQDPSVKAFVHYEARGTVLILGPWNFPFHLCVEPLISALAAGNSAVIKPASMAPATSAVLAKIVRDVFDESEVAVFEGSSDVANALLEKPFDHVFFTGSPKVGKIIMAAAAKNLTSVTLELGGKNPAIIDETADLDEAASGIVTSRVMNNGQTCLSIDYVLVPEARTKDLIDKMSSVIKDLTYTDGKFDSAKTGRFIDDRNFERVKGYVDDAVERGATIAFGGSSSPNELTMEPTILTEVPADAEIMQDEIFGPVTVVLPYSTVDDALATIQRHGKPLGSLVFSTDEAFVENFIQNTTSGGVSVNSWAGHYFDGSLPFGGVNGSGIGSYHSIYGFKAFSHERAVWQRGVTKVAA
ncbi:aldehyde dehydrogenase family protein [Rhizobium bangladeshense]|uniref:aldehyde dehydrogenase family protein n=2 Tax=Rhizobium bangladeshense TaxID=1138189 RepID=UPI001C82CC1B|nr:aldehyde dehydrogenase family protein [Rhizobium bangladeshense]MBX4901499.1 aldehyde dehydrogenase family protein [Rhizobium bangladeshense]